MMPDVWYARMDAPYYQTERFVFRQGWRNARDVWYARTDAPYYQTERFVFRQGWRNARDVWYNVIHG